jgi:hypothetical protein
MAPLLYTTLCGAFKLGASEYRSYIEVIHKVMYICVSDTCLIGYIDTAVMVKSLILTVHNYWIIQKASFRPDFPYSIYVVTLTLNKHF